MGTSIPGGAYQNPDGSWHNANGEPLTKEQIKEAEALAEVRTEEGARQELALQQQAAQRGDLFRQLLNIPVAVAPAPAKKVEAPAPAKHK